MADQGNAQALTGGVQQQAGVGYSYGQNGTPTHYALAEKLAQLEGGGHTVLVPSGLAAITLVSSSVLSAGDHVLLPVSVYGPTLSVTRELFGKWGVRCSVYQDSGADIGQLFEARTRLVWVESPASNSLQMQDVPAIVAAAHAHGADGISVALRAGVDSIEHGTLIDDENIALFKKTGAYYVPTLSTVNGYLERIAKDPNAYPPEVRAKIDWRITITGKALEKATKGGVKIAFGTDAGVSKHGRNADEFELMVQHGMTPQGALVAATINAADLLGWKDRVGSISVGKYADIIATPGNAADNATELTKVSFVMKGGAVIRQQ